MNLCNHCFAIILQSLRCNFTMQSSLCNLCYAIFAMQSLLRNLCYATFAMQSLLFAENIEKPLVFIGFCIQSARKPYKTCAFCYILLKILKNHRFSFVFWAPIAKKPYKTCAFLHFVHRNTYRNTPDNGREGDNTAQLVRTQVRTPKCKHCLGKFPKFLNFCFFSGIS